jgi:hypothetical protein
MQEEARGCGVTRPTDAAFTGCGCGASVIGWHAQQVITLCSGPGMEVVNPSDCSSWNGKGEESGLASYLLRVQGDPLNSRLPGPLDQGASHDPIRD